MVAKTGAALRWNIAIVRRMMALVSDRLIVLNKRALDRIDPALLMDSRSASWDLRTAFLKRRSSAKALVNVGCTLRDTMKSANLVRSPLSSRTSLHRSQLSFAIVLAVK